MSLPCSVARTSTVLLAGALALAAAATSATSATAAGAEPTPSAVHAAPTAGPVVQGAILAHYQALGGSGSFLGRPLTSELGTPDGAGRYNVFQGGSIYWSAATGAWEVHGLIRDHWGSLGWENSLLRFPVSDERVLRGGALSRFQGGSVYWSPATGAHEVHGDILRGYAALGAEAGRLGYPITDELPTTSRAGAYSAFQGGAVYWSPSTGAHDVEGEIRARWEALGAQDGLGFPIEDEAPLPGGRVSEFERGQISWTPQVGAVVTRGAGQVTTADIARRTVTVDSLEQSYTWDRGDEFAASAAGTDEEPKTLTRRQFERVLADELASTRARPFLAVDYTLDPSGTSRFTLLLQSEPGLTPAPAGTSGPR